MIVYLRHMDFPETCEFEDIPFSEIPKLVTHIRNKGVYVDAIGGVYRECDYQFFLDADAAFAEIILTGDPE